jgi:hypothetical protein
MEKEEADKLIDYAKKLGNKMTLVCRDFGCRTCGLVYNTGPYPPVSASKLTDDQIIGHWSHMYDSEEKAILIELSIEEDVLKDRFLEMLKDVRKAQRDEDGKLTKGPIYPKPIDFSNDTQYTARRAPRRSTSPKPPVTPVKDPVFDDLRQRLRGNR